MSQLEPYAEYRTVNMRWLRTLPKDWGLSRVRYVCDVTTGSGDRIDSDVNGGYPFYVRSPNPLASSGYSFDTEAVLTAGDGAVGEVFHHVNGKFHAHQRVYVLHRFRGVRPRFFFYYFSALFRLMCSDGAARTTVDSVRRWMVTDMPLPAPPLDEQRAIADFLDEQTSKIDLLIAKQNQLIDTLLERRGAFLAHHFGTSSGRRATSVRRVLRPIVRPAPDGLGVITAYRDGMVTLRSSRREDGYTLSEGESGYKEIRPGDLVFHGLDGFAGACGVSDSHGSGSPVYQVCEPVDGDDVHYIALLLRYLGTSGFLATQAPNVRQRSIDFRNWETFARVPLSLPSISEQRALLQANTAQAAKIDALIAKTQEHIALAKERRAALITAAVTGQFDVRTATRKVGA